MFELSINRSCTVVLHLKRLARFRAPHNNYQLSFALYLLRLTPGIGFLKAGLSLGMSVVGES